MVRSFFLFSFLFFSFFGRTNTGFASTVDIAHDKVGLLIGAGGSTVRKLEEDLHIQLDIPKEAPSDPDMPRVAVIRGMPAAVRARSEREV